METNPSNADTPQPLSVPAVVMLVSAFVGFIAVYYHWFSYTLPIPPSSGGTLTVYRNGFADASGTLAVVSAGVAFVGASLAMILNGEGARRAGLIIGLLGGVALVGSCILGFVNAGDVGAGLLGSSMMGGGAPMGAGLAGFAGNTAHTGKAAVGLYISLVSGLAVVVAAAVALRALSRPATPAT